MNEHHQPFEEIRHYGTEGQEFWSARELAPLLDYRGWRNFQRYWPARLKRAKPAIKLHLTISLKPPKWLY